MKNFPQSKRVGSVDNSIAIIHFLATSNTAMRLMDISSALNINNSTCLSILRTLVYHDIVSIDNRTKRYSIGSYFDRMQHLLHGKDKAERLGMEMMKQLAQEFDIVLTIWTKTDEKTWSVSSVIESGGELRISIPLGVTRPIYFGSIGRMYAAHIDAPEEELRRACASYEWQVPLSPDTYIAEVEEARRQGWAVDNGYAVRNMCAITVPLPNPDGMMTRALGAGMFQATWNDKRQRDAIIARLLRVAQAFAIK